jgi:hypothetical protein
MDEILPSAHPFRIPCVGGVFFINVTKRALALVLISTLLIGGVLAVNSISQTAGDEPSQLAAANKPDATGRQKTAILQIKIYYAPLLAPSLISPAT